MKRKLIYKIFKNIALLIFLSFMLLLAIQIYIQNNEKKEKVDILKNYDANLLRTLLNGEKESLSSLAVLMANDYKIKILLENKDKKNLLEYINNKFKILENAFQINEIHIVDKNGNSVVSVIDYLYGKHRDMNNNNILSFRKDIKHALTKKEPVFATFVCRYIVGIRAIYPIKDRNVLLGAISLGKSYQSIIDEMREYSHKKVFLLLYKDALQKCLKKDIYQSFKNKSSFSSKEFIIYGDINPSFLTVLDDKSISRYFIQKLKSKTYLYDFYPIKDYSGVEIGKIGVISDLSFIYEDYYLSAIFTGFVFIILLSFLFILLRKQQRLLDTKIQELNMLTENILKRNFSILKIYKNITNPKDELDELKIKIIKMGFELKDYIDQLNQKIKQFRKESFIDALTGALNRRALSKIGNAVFEQAKLKNIPLSAIVLDIDFFKKINDTYGHHIGDEVLKHLVNLIKNIISKRDILIRFGGEEFVILLPGADKKTAFEIAEKIRKKVKESPIKLPDGTVIKYTISAGVDTLIEDDEDIIELIIRSDENLYKAKNTGRNKVVD